MSENITRSEFNALAADVQALTASVQALVANLQPSQPAKAATASAKKTTRKASAKKASPKADNEFVTWLRDTAEARAERKTTNRELAAALREAGIEPNGAAWAAAKASKATTLKGKVAAARKAA